MILCVCKFLLIVLMEVEKKKRWELLILGGVKWCGRMRCRSLFVVFFEVGWILGVLVV